MKKTETYRRKIKLALLIGTLFILPHSLAFADDPVAVVNLVTPVAQIQQVAQVVNPVVVSNVVSIDSNSNFFTPTPISVPATQETNVATPAVTSSSDTHVTVVDSVTAVSTPATSSNIVSPAAANEVTSTSTSSEQSASIQTEKVYEQRFLTKQARADNLKPVDEGTTRKIGRLGTHDIFEITAKEKEMLMAHAGISEEEAAHVFKRIIEMPSSASGRKTYLVLYYKSPKQLFAALKRVKLHLNKSEKDIDIAEALFKVSRKTASSSNASNVGTPSKPAAPSASNVSDTPSVVGAPSNISAPADVATSGVSSISNVADIPEVQEIHNIFNVFEPVTPVSSLSNVVNLDSTGGITQLAADSSSGAATPANTPSDTNAPSDASTPNVSSTPNVVDIPKIQEIVNVVNPVSNLAGVVNLDSTGGSSQLAADLNLAPSSQTFTLADGSKLTVDAQGRPIKQDAADGTPADLFDWNTRTAIIKFEGTTYVFRGLQLDPVTPDAGSVEIYSYETSDGTTQQTQTHLIFGIRDFTV